MDNENAQFAVWIPAYISAIVERLKRRNWLIHNFPLNVEDVHDPAGYLCGNAVNNTEYVCVLDANIFQFIVNASKKRSNADHHRDAIALVVFCQFSEIDIDPALACYERINHLEKNADEAVRELLLFRKIDNADSEKLAAYALGITDVVSLNEAIQLDLELTKKKLLQYRRLTNWDSMYLMVLKIVQIKFFETSSNQAKLERFISWCFSDFRLSIVAIVYSAIFFGKTPTKKMMKFSPLADKAEKRKAVENMTWDFFNASRYFELWVSNAKSEYIFASDDLAFKEVLRQSILAQNPGTGFANLKEHITETSIKYLNAIEGRRATEKNRMYQSEIWSQEYRQKLIVDLESSLFF